MRGRHSFSLWGLVDDSLSSNQCFGAAKHFRCFLGPQAMAVLGVERGCPCLILTVKKSKKHFFPRPRFPFSLPQTSYELNENLNFYANM